MIKSANTSQQSHVLSCSDAMQKSRQGQHAALAAFVQNVNFLMPLDDTLASSDIRTDPGFWALLRQLLVSSAIMSPAALPLIHSYADRSHLSYLLLM